MRFDPKSARGGLQACLLFFAIVIAILRWLWSDAFLCEFHSDMADTIFWANAGREAGSFASPTFRYNYFIPFGDVPLLRLLLPLCGFGVAAMRCSMSVFLAIFAAAAYCLFRSFRWSRRFRLIAVSFVLAVASATPKMREIHFGHVLYYSLGTVFLFLAVSSLPDPTCGEMRTSGGRPRFLPRLLFFACMGWAASCGTPLLLYAVLPAFGAWALVRMARPDPFSLDREGPALLPGIAGAVFGLALFTLASRGIVPAEYGYVYGLLSSAADWSAHAAALPVQWISLLSPFATDGASVMGADGFPAAMLIGFATLLALCPVIALARIRAFPARERLLVAAHWILAAEILFLWIFGNISDGDWRLAPVALSAAAVSACLLRNLARDGTALARRCALGCILFAFLACLLVLIRGVLPPENRDVWNGKGTLIPLLEEIGIRDGYCSDYWFSNATTVLSGSRFRLREVRLLADGAWHPRPYLSDERWYEPDSGRTNTVFVCHPTEESSAPPGDVVARYECTQFDFWNKQTDKLVVFVYVGDCLNPTSGPVRETLSSSNSEEPLQAPSRNGDSSLEK